MESVQNPHDEPNQISQHSDNEQKAEPSTEGNASAEGSEQVVQEQTPVIREQPTVILEETTPEIMRSAPNYSQQRQ